MRHPPRIAVLLAAALAACARDSTTTAPPDVDYVLIPPGATLEIVPDMAKLAHGDMQRFDAFVTAPGFPRLPVDVAWSADTDIGTIDMTFGQSTTLTAALPDGARLSRGQVRAAIDGLSGFADVLVHPGGDGPPDGVPIGQMGSPCVMFTSNTVDVGEQCNEKAARIFIQFPAGSGATVTLADGSVSSADATEDGLRVDFDHVNGTMKSALWTKPGSRGAGRTINGAKGATRVDFDLSSNEITAARWNSIDARATIPISRDHGPVNDAHVYFKAADGTG